VLQIARLEECYRTATKTQRGRARTRERLSRAAGGDFVRHNFSACNRAGLTFRAQSRPARGDGVKRSSCLRHCALRGSGRGTCAAKSESDAFPAHKNCPSRPLGPAGAACSPLPDQEIPVYVMTRRLPLRERHRFQVSPLRSAQAVQIINVAGKRNVLRKRVADHPDDIASDADVGQGLRKRRRFERPVFARQIELTPIDSMVLP
jgi:hypothetical protein